QPLYNRDFCRVILFWVEHQPNGAIYDIVGAEDVTYIDIIRLIRQVKQLKTPIICIPYSVFYLLLKIYALFSKTPPFTASQLKALTVGDYFSGVDIEKEFGVKPTPFRKAVEETFTDTRYSSVVIER
ncbi:MAG: NAD(P)-dependent oxidoreductase, partial [Pseudomonadales bacterium]|nr:NAD(P)-dependent oxidoreductase [Pseudomonadales bacterium]